MTTRNRTGLFFTRVFALTGALAFGWLTIGVAPSAPAPLEIPAAEAQEDDDDGPEDTGTDDAQTPEEQDTACSDAVKGCNFKPVTDAYGAMRASCNEFRACKRGCNTEKAACAGAARAAKRECKAECKALKGKAAKECRKECRKEKREAKRACREAKRTCKDQCVKDYRDQDCVKARASFWGTLGNATKECAANLFNSCESPFPKN